MKKLYKNNKKKSIEEFIFDKKGILKGIIKQKDGLYYNVLYRKSEEDKFNLSLRFTWKDYFEILHFHPTIPHYALVATNINRDKIAIALYDLCKGKQVKVLFEHPLFDISDISFSRKRALWGVVLGNTFLHQ